MRTFSIANAVWFGLFVVACGGADATIIGDDGGADTATSNDGGTGNDVTNPSDGSPADVINVTCDAGLLACNGQCVDIQSDAQNCGGCGVVCNTQCTAGICPLIGGSCDGGTQPANDQACLTIDSTNAYWGTGFSPGGTVWKVPLAGGCPSLMVGNQLTPHAMASDGTNLFFANLGGNNVLGSVQRIPVNGNVATPIAIAQQGPSDVAVDGTNVYWTNNGDGSVWKSDKTTPNPIKLAGPLGQGHASHLRLDATYVYFTDHSAGVVNRVPIAGGNVVTLTTQTPGMGYLALDKTNIYFGAFPSKAGILSIPLSAQAGTTPTSLVSNLPYTNGVETDGTMLYWAEISNVNPYVQGTGEIHRATVGGQNDTVLVTKQNGPNCIALDATSVYWINDLGGMVSKTAK